MTQKQARERLWHLTIIAPWYLYKYQKPVYEFFEKTKNPFFEATRRFGKSCTKLVQIQERSRRQPQRVTFWAEPWKEQARNIVIPEMDRIQASCPASLRAKFYRTDSFFEFPTTGSRIYLLGTNEDKAEGVRGRFAHEIVCDEIGSFVDADYVLNEVFWPMLLTTNGELCELGTPPRDLGHLFYERKKIAIQENRYIARDFDAISTDVIPQQEKDSFMLSMGGRESTAVRRELYLEPVADESLLVVPEFKKDIHVVDEYKLPRAITPYVGIDLGLNDCTALIFGFYDFENATLVIQDEIIIKGKNTKEITELAKAKEHQLWGDLKVQKAKVQRWSDNDLQQLYDMNTVYQYLCNPTRKDDKLAAINSLRLRFTNQKIKILSKCKGLIFQLQVGIWNDKRTSFLRSENTGHLDAIDALVYLNRNVNESLNPFDASHGVNPYTHYIPEELVKQNIDKKPATSEELQIGNIFGGI